MGTGTRGSPRARRQWGRLALFGASYRARQSLALKSCRVGRGRLHHHGSIIDLTSTDDRRARALTRKSRPWEMAPNRVSFAGSCPMSYSTSPETDPPLRQAQTAIGHGQFMNNKDSHWHKFRLQPSTRGKCGMS